MLLLLLLHGDRVLVLSFFEGETDEITREEVLGADQRPFVATEDEDGGWRGRHAPQHLLSTGRLEHRSHLKDDDRNKAPHGVGPVLVEQPEHRTKHLKDGQRGHHLLLG